MHRFTRISFLVRYAYETFSQAVLTSIRKSANLDMSQFQKSNLTHASGKQNSGETTIILFYVFCNYSGLEPENRGYCGSLHCLDRDFAKLNHTFATHYCLKRVYRYTIVADKIILFQRISEQCHTFQS